MRRTMLTTALLVTLAAPGCELLYPADRYLGSGSDGGPGQHDGGPIVHPDGGPDVDSGPPDGGPESPSTPGIAIDPASPITTDDLTVRITTESVDPLNETVTYEYEWLKGTTSVLTGTTTVPADQTTKHDEWTVVVTPVAGGRRGAPARATVTIANAPPVVTTVGLEDYRPLNVGSLHALSGAVSDADGDTTTRHYVWSVNGTAVSGVSNSVLPLTTYVGGEEITVELTVSDGEADSAPVTAGPAIVRADDVTRWRQLWPDRNRLSFAIHDATRERILLGIGSGGAPVELWEYDLGTDRFIQLHPEGTLDVTFPASIVAAPDGRIWVFSGSTFAELQIPQRGMERWRMLTATGDAPDAASSLPGGVYDEARDRILMSLQDTDTGMAQIYSVQPTDTDAVMTLEWSGVTTAIGGSWVRVPGRREVLVLGGGDPASDPFTPNDSVHRIDLDALDGGFIELSAHLASPRAVPIVGVDPVHERIIYGFGITEDAGNFLPASDMFTVDYDGTGSTPYTFSGPAPTEGGFTGWIEWDAGRDRLMVFPGTGRIFDSQAFQLWAVDATDTFSPIHVFGQNAPTPVRQSMATVISDRAYAFGGRDRYRTTSGELWSVSLTGTFTGFNPVTATGGPGPRYGQVIQQGTNDIRFFGGGIDADGFADPAITWRFDGTSWSSAMDSTPLVGWTGSFIFQPSCSADLGFIGGTPAATAPSNVGEATCSGASCDWMPIAPTGASPPAFSGTPGWRIGNDVVMLTPSSGLYVYDPCSHVWRTGTVDGAAPSTGSGYSITDNGILFGGLSGSSSYQNTAYQISYVGPDTYQFDPITVDASSELPPGRAQHVAVYDATRGRMLIYGGWSGAPSWFGTLDFVYGDVWELRIR